MLTVFNSWYRKYFTDSEAVILLVLLVVGLLVIVTMGQMLAPVLASLVFAYVLDWVATAMTRRGLPRALSVITTFVAFVGLFLLIFFWLLPMLWRQTLALANELPSYISSWQSSLALLPDRYPGLITEEQITLATNSLKSIATQVGHVVFSTTLSSIPSLMAMFIYLIIVPLMVFFFLFDRDKILNWCVLRLPTQRTLLTRVWRDVNSQLGNYVRGKVVEIMIVAAVTLATFSWLELNYTALLSVAVGLSVLLPYVGAAVVTLPIALVAIFQFGWSPEFVYIMVAYGIIQALDGNVLVPLLFSEVVNLHPVAIITSILIFGGIWGFWGIFFAIPLAILCQALMSAWPRVKV